MVRRRSARSVQWNVQPFINGRYSTSSAAASIANINPATELPLCMVSAGNSADVDAAVQVARYRYRQRCWSGLPPGRRGEILVKLADLMVHHKEQLALLDTL